VKRCGWKVVGVLLALTLAYLLAWPVPIEPVAWQPPPAPAETGLYAPNDRLRAVEWLGRGEIRGPEATAIDREGRVYTGTLDGRVLRLDPASGRFATFAATGGRPLGMAFDAAGTLYVCDAVRGLLAVSPGGEVRGLVAAHDGVRFGFTDDVDVAPDGTVYFSDATSRFGPGRHREDILEHRGSGRLFAYHPDRGALDLLLGGLEFANGVAVAGDGSYVLVNETGAYRVTRYWLTGPRRGTAEPFFENLPGLPDNVTWSPSRQAFWVALFSPRVRALDLLAGAPFLRRVVLRLPLWVQPDAARSAWALAIDEQSRVVESLRDASPTAYAPLTSVRERDGVLWLGSLEREALGRMPAPPLSN
jgi:sugar lactone lactonase YvrE